MLRRLSPHAARWEMESLDVSCEHDSASSALNSPCRAASPAARALPRRTRRLSWTTMSANARFAAAALAALNACVLPDVSARRSAQAVDTESAMAANAPTPVSNNGQAETSSSSPPMTSKPPEVGAGGRSQRSDAGSIGDHGLSSHSSAGHSEAAATAGTTGSGMQNATAGRPADATAASGAAFGSPCSDSSQCGSKFCTDGVCCKAPVCGTCQICAPSGECETIKDLTGALAKDRCLPRGASCEIAATCVTGLCVTGRCCDVASCDVCSACAASGDTAMCAPLSGVDDTHGKCSKERSCVNGRCVDVIADTALDTNSGGGSDGYQRLYAQTVRFDANRELVEVRLQIMCESDAVSVDLRGVMPDGTPSAVKLVPTLTARVARASQFESIALTLKNPLPVMAGSSMAVVLTGDGDARCTWWFSNRDTYPAGTAFEADPSGASWKPRAQADFVLRVLAQN